MALKSSATVCALVPYYDCAEWLPGAIESLLAQTRPLDAVIVLDDASSEPPYAVARSYPSVTFVRAAQNVGPYRMLQTAIDRTDFDAYLFQDADDLSHPERLAALLEVAAAQRADMVGSHEVQIDVAAPEARPREYPLDVNAALAGDPIAFALLHPTSLVSREALLAAGGLPGGLRFSGDVDFLWRAGHVARIVNADRHLYLRRRHPGSLTASRATGTGSPARRALDGALRDRARANARRAASGLAPDLSSFSEAPPVAFEHLAGPHLGSRLDRGARPRRTCGKGGPVLVVGGPRNGGDVLAWALDLHPRFEVLADITDLETRSGPRALRPVVAGPAVTAAALALADRYPDARIVHVERDVDTTVASLAGRPDAHGDFYTERSAREVAVALGLSAELLSIALGPDRVLRVGLGQMIDDPPAVVAAVLAFLGEEVSPGSAMALSGLSVVAGDVHRAGHGLSPADARRALEARALAALPPLPARLRALSSCHLPDGAVVVVVSRGDPQLLDIGPAQARHFPATADGAYAGEYPPTGAAAVALLEDARRNGATHFLVPAPAAWWLSHYDELRAHLDRHYRLMVAAEGTGAIYDLTGPHAVAA
jgi:hypothetical protein